MFRDNQYVDGPWFRTHSSALPVHIITSFYLAKYDRVVIAYCQHKRNTQIFPYLIWYLPFCWETWIVMGTFLLVMILIEQQLQHANFPFSIYNILGDFFGQLGLEEKNKHKILLVTSLASFSLQNYYRETITSVIAVSLPPALHHSVRNILEAGYKIIWYSTPGDYQPPFTDLYTETFKLKGIYNRFNQSFKIINYLVANPYNFATLLVQKLGLPIAEFNFGFMKELLEQHTNRITGSNQVQFYSVTEPLKEQPRFWEIHLINKYWLAQSLVSMQEAGLVLIWNTWSTYRYKLNWGAFKSNNNNVGILKDDQINLQKFMPCVWCWVSLLISSFAVLLMENDNRVHFIKILYKWLAKRLLFGFINCIKCILNVFVIGRQKFQIMLKNSLNIMKCI